MIAHSLCECANLLSIGEALRFAVSEMDVLRFRAVCTSLAGIIHPGAGNDIVYGGGGKRLLGISVTLMYYSLKK